MSKVFFKHGNAAVGVSDELERLVNQLLDANPIIKRTMQDAVEEIYQEAYKQWPVRIKPPKTEEQKKEATFFAIAKSSGKTKKDAAAIVKSLDQKGRFRSDLEAKISDKSQDSKNKLERGIMIDGPDIVAFVRNNAPYAWAIKTGQYTINDLAFGTRTCNELLWKPMQNAGKKLVDVLADDLINQAKKG
mgnify:CR=1 FL=1